MLLFFGLGFFFVVFFLNTDTLIADTTKETHRTSCSIQKGNAKDLNINLPEPTEHMPSMSTMPTVVTPSKPVVELG